MLKKPDKPIQGTEIEKAIASCRSSLWLIFLFSIITNLLMLSFPIYMLQIYDRVLTTGHTDTLMMLTLVVGGALLLMACIDGLRTAMAHRVGAWLVERLGPVFLSSSVRARVEGEAASSRSISDLAAVRNFISTQGLTFFCDAPWVPFYVIVIWLIHPYLGMLALVTAILLLIMSLVNEASTRPLVKTASELNASAGWDADATVRNAEVASAMGMMPELIGRWQNKNLRVIEQLRRSGERSGILVSITKFIRMFAQVGILGLGAFLVISNDITAGSMIACSILLGRALAPVEMAMGAWRTFTNARLAYGRLKQQLADYPTPERRMPLPVPKGHLSVKRLSYEKDGQHILKNVTFAIEPGDALAIIGPSAAGKSTLCRFLVGLSFAKDGEVRIDNSEMQHWDPAALGPHLGYLPQNVELFAGTIKENICRMSSGHDEGVVEAANLAHAHAMIQRLPEGYNTPIGEGGMGLSGGQRQRIGLARAVFNNPKLIVLDEPNANLDQAGESALAGAVAQLKQGGATIVMTGHRPSTLAEATKIMILQDGQVQMFGPRDEILAKLREKQAAKATLPVAGAAAAI